MPHETGQYLVKTLTTNDREIGIITEQIYNLYKREYIAASSGVVVVWPSHHGHSYSWILLDWLQARTMWRGSVLLPGYSGRFPKVTHC